MDFANWFEIQDEGGVLVSHDVFMKYSNISSAYSQQSLSKLLTGLLNAFCLMYKSIYCGIRYWLYNNYFDMSNTTEQGSTDRLIGFGPWISATEDGFNLCFDSETGWKNFHNFEILSNREYVNRIG